MQTNEEQQLFAIDFYLEVNGVLELNKLQELLKNSKINLSSNQIIDYIKEKEYIFEDNIIYFSESAKILNENHNINNLKKKQKYKVFSLEEMNEIKKSLEEANYQKQLEKILSKYIKDKQKREGIANTIIDIVLIGYDIANFIQIIYKYEKIDITVGDSDDIDTIAMDIYANYPSWKLNGFTQNELTPDNEYEDFSNEEELPFEEWPLDEQIELYIIAYLIINGIIKIDIFLEILENEHNINIRKSKLKKIIQEINIIATDDTYIKLNYLTEEDVNELINQKENLNDYKIIDDINEIITDHNNLKRKLKDICNNYEIPDYIKLYIEELTHKIRIPKDLLATIFKAGNLKLEHKIITNIYQELKPYLDKARIWRLNGYTYLELKEKATPQSKKIGRNDPCPCGSGLKYKKCCGKN